VKPPEAKGSLNSIIYHKLRKNLPRRKEAKKEPPPPPPPPPPTPRGGAWAAARGAELAL